METAQDQSFNAGKVSKKANKLPTSDIDVADLALKVAQTWRKSSLTLAWITADDFEKLTQEFALNLRSRKMEGLTRPQITKRLKELDKQIDQNLAYVKNYITEEVGKGNEFAYYPQLGIEKVRNTFKLPVDRNKRLSALNIFLKGIKDRGYGDKQYGIAFWEAIVVEYANLMKQANDNDSTVSGKVSTKNQSKEQVVKVLNAITFLLQANYPDTYASELRVWGFQKEKY